MNTLGPRERQSLRNFLQSSRTRLTPSTKLATFLLDAYGECFLQSGTVFQFTEQQKQTLARLIRQTEGEAFLRPIQAEDDRIKVAGQHNREKDAKKRPNQDYLYLTQHSGPLTCAGMSAPVPDGSSLRISLDSLHMDEVKQLIIVENLQAFDYLHQACLPEELHNVPAFYRGHDAISASVNKLLNHLPADIQVIAFMDLDPQGVKMALELKKVDYLLVPDLPLLSDQVKRQVSQPQVYLKQSAAAKILKLTAPNAAPRLQTAVLNPMLKNHLAISQEHMIAHQIALKWVAVR